jgi:hypothetical protein
MAPHGRLAWLVVAGYLAVAGCLTPSVPIPPPEPEKMAFDLDLEAGTARYSFAPDASYGKAVVYVFNRDRGRGVITTANDDGSVDPTEPFVAADGDEIVVTFELEAQVASTCVVLHDGPSSSAYECDL